MTATGSVPAPGRDGIAQVEVVASRVVVGGEIDMWSSQLLAAALETAIDHGGPVLLDLGAVTFMDAAGLRVLASVAVVTGDLDGVEVVAVSPVVRRLFTLVGRADAVLERDEVPTGR